jgi:sugar lactone lactonase YvrE
MHTLPQLRRLEEKFPNELAVIGVHSPKFPFEAETESVRMAVLRHGVEHPVVNDRDHTVWMQYAVRAWPTIYLVDPLGKAVGKHEGEINVETFERILREAVQEFDAKGAIDRRKLAWPPERLREPGRPLAFPGKVLADVPSNRLIIADSGHNRVLAADLQGRVQRVIGSGEPGLTDGPFQEARFTYPQGLALDGNTLYVADTENHAIRRVDLAAGVVETIAGTGRQARAYSMGGLARQEDLSSPWDLALVDNLLVIAMAGVHQIWGLELGSDEVMPIVGGGPEGLGDGALAESWLAQTSGLSRGEGRVVWFVDSETSSIRSAELTPDGDVRTLIGAGLFEFGDVDGPRSIARLQHPLGIAWSPEAIYVADTFNNKVKAVPLNGEAVVKTLIGAGEMGLRDGPFAQAQLHEPGGLSLAVFPDGRRLLLYIADTNNHAIRVADLTTGEVTTLEVTGV